MNEVVYPHLAKIARDTLQFRVYVWIIILIINITLTNKTILMINKATSVPVERVFSGGTDLIAAKRCSLKADTIRACMCLKSWQTYSQISVKASDIISIL